MQTRRGSRDSFSRARGREKRILVLSVILTRGLGCLVSFGDAKEAGLEPTLWALRLLQSVALPPALEIKSPVFTAFQVAVVRRAVWRASLPDGEPGILRVSLQAGEGRGSSVKAKSSSKAALRGCRDGTVGTAASWPGICLSEQLSRVGIYAGPASVQSSACPPQTSFAAVPGAPSWSLGAARHRS